MTSESTEGAPLTTNSQAAIAQSYRANAIAEREGAETETLPNRKALRLRSAEVWDERAEALEGMLSKREINEAGKKPYRWRQPATGEAE